MKEYRRVEASSWNSQYVVPLFSKNLMGSNTAGCSALMTWWEGFVVIK